LKEFNIADSHLRETLPPVISAAFSLIPPLLAAHVTIQNRLLGLYYTVLHNYCSENDFPSPPPPMEDVIALWSGDYKPVQKEVESIPCIAHGKAVRMPMNIGYDGSDRKPSTSSTASAKNGLHRTTSGLIPGATPSNGTTSPIPRPMRIPSSTSLSAPSPSEYSPQPSPRSSSTNVNVSGMLRPTDFTTATALGGTTPVSPQVRNDYFSSREQASSQATTPTGTAVAKKKPPPPPPPPKRPAKLDEFVVALYNFSGQGQGDLSFREGDRIKIVKKTNTDQDWWVGELAGVRGNFPANYCKPA
jgi:amphiphysin